MDLLSTLRFIRSMLTAPDRPVGEPHPLDTPPGRIPADVYRPRRAPWASVLVLHGLAIRGRRDPRLVRLGWALADTGVQAVLPQIQAMADLRLHPLAWPTIAEALAAVADRPELRGPGRVGILAPSYAGGQSLLAATQPAVRDHVSALVLVGAYADGRSLLHHVMATVDGDAYGRLILVRHALEAADALTPGLASAIDAQLLDLSSAAEAPRLPGVLAEMADVERDRFLELRDDVRARIAFANQVLAQHGEAIDSLTVTPALDTLEAPVALLHGVDDPVIPSTESRSIHEALSRQGKPVRLCVTRLLDHGNITARGQSLLDLPRLVRTFGFWFAHLRR